jgi:hypothetical protein
MGDWKCESEKLAALLVQAADAARFLDGALLQARPDERVADLDAHVVGDDALVAARVGARTQRSRGGVDLTSGVFHWNCPFKVSSVRSQGAQVLLLSIRAACPKTEARDVDLISLFE